MTAVGMAGAALVALLAMEVALRLPVGPMLADLLAVTRKAMAVAASRNISDRWKERAMAAYARATLRHSLRLGGVIAAVLAAAGAGALALQALGLPGVIAALASPAGLAVCCLTAAGHVRLRQGARRDDRL